MTKSVACPCGGRNKEYPDCGGTGVIVIVASDIVYAPEHYDAVEDAVTPHGQDMYKCPICGNMRGMRESYSIMIDHERQYHC